MFCRGWLGYAFATLLICFATFMLITRCCGQGRPVDELKLKVIAPPAMNTMEQLLAVQNAISQAEELIQDGNVALLKCRALLLSIFPQVLFSVLVLLDRLFVLENSNLLLVNYFVNNECLLFFEVHSHLCQVPYTPKSGLDLLFRWRN